MGGLKRLCDPDPFKDGNGLFDTYGQPSGAARRALAEELAARDEGAARALAAEATKEQLLDAIQDVAFRAINLTSTDVHAELQKQGLQLSHPNAMGGAFLAACARRWIVDSGLTVHSDRPGAHARRLVVWTSLIHRGAHAPQD